MKKWLVLLLALMMVTGLAVGCAEEAVDEPIDEPVDEPTDDPADVPEMVDGVILIGRPNPDTGPLASFGEGSPWVEQRVVDYINEQGGIYIEEFGGNVPIELIFVDTESSPDTAAEVTSRLILDHEVDMLVSLHTPDTTVPAASMAERYQVPNVSLDTPVDPWLGGGPYEWSFHAFWTLDMLMDLFVSMWETQVDEVGNVVGIACPDDPDGVAWANAFNEILPARDFEVVDVGRFPYGLDDFGSFLRTWEAEDANIVSGVLIPPDFATMWRQAHREDLVPQIATIGKAILFASAVEALGDDLGHGLTSEVWWTPHHPFTSSLTGESAADLAAAYEEETGRQWTQTLGFKYAGLEIAIDALQRAGTLDKEAIRDAIAATELDTMVGPINYNEQNYSTTPLVGGQWVKGEGEWPWELEIVYNETYPEIPKTAEMFLIGE